VHVCNKTTKPIWVAYADHAFCHGFGNFDCGTNSCGGNALDAHWAKSGWYVAQPGACTTPNGGDADDFVSFIYAEDGTGKWWGGDWQNSQDYAFLCTPSTAYHTCTATQYGDYPSCSGGDRSLDYKRWFPSTEDWTLNLNP
jgi:hypothetical protein